MLLRAIAIFCLTVAVAATSACDPCRTEPGGDGVAVDGVELYEYSSEAGGTIIRIYRGDGGTLQLVYVDQQGRIEAGGQVHATLTAEALDLLNSTGDGVAGGAELGGFDPECLGFVDSPVARLWLPAPQGRLEFGYPWGCAPSSFTVLDEMLQELVLELPECDESTLFQDCKLGA